MISGGSVPSFKTIVSTILAAVISCSTFAHADGEKLVEVRIQGNRRIESPTILNAVKIKAGDTLDNDKTDADLRAIYKLGHFQDVQALKEESDKGFVNVRTAMYWSLREQLNPNNHPTLCLPDDPMLIGDLTAVKYTMRSDGIIIAESKDDIKKRIGRSTDDGDAVALACWKPEINIPGVYVVE